MIEDARHIPADTVIEADVCIIGAGAAGLTVAYNLANTKSRICVIESGGYNYERRAQDLSRGISVGAPYEALDLCRVRQLGGTTSRTGWGGWCKPLEVEDFEERPWVSLGGWPLSRRDLDPYYTTAADLLGIKNDIFAKADDIISCNSPIASESCFVSPRADLRNTLMPTLDAAPNLRVVIHATALRLCANCQGNHVDTIEVASTQAGPFQVKAGVYVLAGGGIENARLLLLSNGHNPAGLGNQHDQVGRHFMEHPRVTWGVIKPHPNGFPLTLFDPALPYRSSSTHPTAAPRLGNEGYGLVIRPEIRKRLHLLGSRTWIKPSVGFKKTNGADALQYVTFWLRKGRPHRDLLKHAGPVLLHPTSAIAATLARLVGHRLSPRQYRFDTILEQDPHPHSRITLDHTLDELGSRRAKLDWRISSLVRHTLEQVQTIIVTEMRELGHLCSSGLQDDGAIEARIEPAFSGVRHHMGTTRMSDDPTKGVVDANCRVHGVHNLFVAGSSVFPTGGNDMPTFTIIALALRLGENLKSLLDTEKIAPAGDTEI
jgi:choline dehydrogenase-like flavoprotein